MPGTVEYGARVDEEGRYRPCIEIRDESGGVVEFAANIAFTSDRECREFCIAINSILSNTDNAPVEYLTNAYSEYDS